MALLKSKDTRAMFLVAVVLMAMVLSPCLAEKCFKMLACTDVSCNRMCWYQGYGPHARTVCRVGTPSPWDTCCCSKR
ncbi:hypothetical protein EJB05_09274 [Eragrostis curvula]|uniref:Uncharacterized protein n=1 Tax=Eragrostis curvula TaxID=38414 RepID=A0A5J9W4H9_9POAL|nr:hypothetical protein EJB05_09274 [Eragrostis curvula]